MSPKYYYYGNASRRLKSGKFTFSFTVIGQFAGAWNGVLKLDDPEAIAAIESDGMKALGVREITLAEYDAYQKKKLNPSKPSPAIILPPASSLKGPAGAAVIRDPSSQITPKSVSVASAEAKPTVQDAVVLGEAPYVDPLEQRNGKKRTKKVSS